MSAHRHDFLAPFRQVFGVARKEWSSILRQPSLVVLLVLGPFAVLLLFAVGYDEEQAVLRTAFVGPADGPYEQSIDAYTDELSYYVDNAGYSTDLVDAERRLSAGAVDVIVVFPVDPVETITNGERALITVLHDKLDPIQQTAVEIATEVAVRELNSVVLEEAVGLTQDAAASGPGSLQDADVLLGELSRAVESADDDTVRTVLDELGGVSGRANALLRQSSAVAERLDATSDQSAALAATEALDDTVRTAQATLDRVGALDREDVEALAEGFHEVDEVATTALRLDPEIIIRPFDADAENLVRQRVDIVDFFAPAAIAILLQHTAVTIAAMGWITDRNQGFGEIYRVSPIGPGRLATGKFIANVAGGLVLGVVLVTAVTVFLGVPLRGSPLAVGVGLLGVLLASVGLGLAVSLVSRTAVQAVQYAMLLLFASLFFAGLFLALDSFRFPVRLVSWVLPATYGGRLLRDVMLRGVAPAGVDVIGLVTTSVVFGLAAWALLARRLKVE